MKKNIKNNTQLALWIGALAVGVIIGLLNIASVNALMNFMATAYTRIFQLLAVPTIALAVTATMAMIGQEKGTGKIFSRALTYTLATTFVAAFVGVGLYELIAPESLPQGLLAASESTSQTAVAESTSYYNHILSVIPNNLLEPLLKGNVLSVLLLAFAVGLGLSRMPASDNKTSLLRLLNGAQDLLFLLIRAFIKTLPLGIMAFAAQLALQFSAGVVVNSLGKYTTVILVANAIQIFLVLPLFLAAHKVNPVKAFSRMSPALIMAFFTKSSAATLPLTMDTAEQRAGVSSRVARFVLPICTTINMNGCAAFIAVTSLFVMQNSGMALSLDTILLWVVIAVIAAIGNAGVPMGCYFLTLSLMSGIGGNIAIMGIILPIYTIIDMVETAENVWSDSCVAIMTDKTIKE